MLRSDLFEVAPEPQGFGGRPRLPRYVAPLDGEALISWVVQLAAALDLAPSEFCRNAFGIDTQMRPKWWQRPEAVTLRHIEAWTNIPQDCLRAMTLTGWAVSVDDTAADRLGAKRWKTVMVARDRALPIGICPQCVVEARRPYIDLLWTVGFAGVCPRHGIALTGKCSTCGETWRLLGMKDAKSIEILICRRCGASPAGEEIIAAHPAALELQAELVAGKRSGIAQLPSVGALDWPTTIALVDILLGIVWVRRPRKQRDYLAPKRRERLFKRICGDLDIAERERADIPWTTNYGGLLILAWLLADLDARLPKAIATLCTPHLDGLLARVPKLDDAATTRLRVLLAAAAPKMPTERHAWRPWLDGLPQSEADLLQRSMRERSKHRRQRMRAFAELKGGSSIEAVGRLIGATPKSIYRWLHWGIAGGLESALERPVGNPVLSSAQAEELARWIAPDRANQSRRKIAVKMQELFGIKPDLDVASRLLAKHGLQRPGRRRRLWGPKHGPRRKAGPTHDPAPGL